MDDWYDLGIRIAAAACGDGVCAVRAINQASVYRAVLGLIHARALTAARGLDLQITIGRQKVSGTRDEPLDAVLMYAWARQPDAMPWEQAPPP